MGTTGLSSRLSGLPLAIRATVRRAGACMAFLAEFQMAEGWVKDKGYKGELQPGGTGVVTGLVVKK